jgi:ATP-binding cassette, subfamily B, bacterial HlyB/CyaB
LDPQRVGLTTDGFIWALDVMARMQRIPFTPDTALQQYLPPYTLNSLQRAALALELKTRVQTRYDGNADIPCLAVLDLDKDRSQCVEVDPTRSAGGCSGSVVLLLGGDEETVQVLEQGEATPKKLPRDELARRHSGIVVFFTPIIPDATGGDGISPSPPQFGFGWFIPELLRYKHIWRDVLLASLAIQLMSLAVPLFTQIVIDKVIAHHALSTLTVIGVALALILLFNSSMGWIRQYLILHTGNRVDAVLGTQVFDHLLKLPYRYHEERPTGVTIARIQGVETIREFLSGAAVTLILDLPFLLIFLAIMLYYSWLLTVVTLAVLAAITILSVAVTPLLRSRINEQFLRGARSQSFLTEYLVGIETVKSLQMEPRVKARFGEYFSSYLQAGFKTRKLAATYQVTATALEQLLTLLVLCTGAWLVMHDNGFTVGMLVAFQMFATRLSQPMLRLVGLWQDFQRAAIAVKRLGDIMNVPAEPYAAMSRRAPTRRGEIAIDAISFRYASNLPDVFCGFTAHIPAGSLVAIIGRSGSGKSTLAKLLQSFYQPSDGRIKIDGQDIRHLSANELRRYFGVVPQDTTLFSGTIYENLMLANPHASFEEVILACKMAGIHGAIEHLPSGYQTEIGQHGAGLSGGQKQRVAISRALLKRPNILIFDEATSNLDVGTAEQLAKTISTLKGRITILFITHHVPKALAVDQVLSLDADSSAWKGHGPNHSVAQS